MTLYPPGPLDAITDVGGIRVGHVTLIEGERTRTGATAILPHDGNPFTKRVTAGMAVLNGYGKFAGLSQVQELGELETPILLTNTLAVGRAIEALNRWTLARNPQAVSINAVVGEVNDSRLNDIRAARPTVEEMLAALDAAAEGPVAQGAVGGGTGAVAFGGKGGIGSASRRVAGAVLGALVQANFGGHLIGGGVAPAPTPDADGSIVIVLATDAPLDARQLTRLARRSFGGLARTGAALSHGSGDYALAFATRRGRMADADLSPLFEAAIEVTEAAIRHALARATAMSGWDAATGRPSCFGTVPA